MIHVLNPEFFRFDIESVKVNNKYQNLINVFTDPKDFDLPQYRKDPFASIVLESDIPMEKKSEKNLALEEILEEIKTSNTTQYSMYTDDEYTELTNIFGGSNRYHTLIFKDVPASNVKEPSYNKNIILAAIPCTGMIQPITKNNNFKLYNAGLVVMNHRPFKWNENYYDKLVYLLIDLTTVFDFQEYRFTDDASKWNVRIAVTHHIGIDFADHNSSDLFDIVYQKTENLVLCGDREDRLAFYEFPKKSMFYLSDIPSKVKIVNGNIQVKMDSNDK